jgi:hypothetical protein
MIRCMRVTASLLAGFVVPLCVITPCRGDLIAYEPFDYGDGDLRGEDGGGGEWGSRWLAGQGFGSGDTWQVGQPSLSYTDSGGRTLPTSGGAVTADSVDSNIEFRDTRSWDTAGHKDASDVLWFSYLFNRSSVATSDLRVNILGDGGLFNDMGVFISSNNTHIAARISVNSNVQTGGAMLFSHDEDHFVVGRITFSDTMDDEVRFWLDPELNAIPLDSAPNSGAVTAAANPSSWHNFYMRQSQFRGLDMIDEIRIGTDFFSVVGAVAIPEPSSFFYLGIAGVVGLLHGVTAARRRRAT